jgi:hypothetical protein
MGRHKVRVRCMSGVEDTGQNRQVGQERGLLIPNPAVRTPVHAQAGMVVQAAAAASIGRCQLVAPSPTGAWRTASWPPQTLQLQHAIPWALRSGTSHPNQKG